MGVLTQTHTTVIDGKSVTTDHPVAFVSGLFRGSQINWAALLKEAFAIYMSVRKLSFYLDQAEILLRNDHLPLMKFLQNTLNSKVNNWAMDMDQGTRLPPEEQRYEFGYAVFEELPKIKCYEINEVIAGDKEIKYNPDLEDALQCIDNPLSAECLQRLQEHDPDIQKLKHKLEHNRLDKEYYKMEDGLLKRKVVDGGHEFWSIYLPASLVLQVLREAHDDFRHNGFPRTYAAVKWIFYWKNIKENI